MLEIPPPPFFSVLFQNGRDFQFEKSKISQADLLDINLRKKTYHIHHNLGI